MKYDLFTFHARIGERWGWWSILQLTLFWAILWPVGLVWFVMSAISRYAKHDTSPKTAVVPEDKARPTPSRFHSTEWGLICWSLCWLPLVGQGLVPMILALTGTEVRALFIAFYLPEALQWPFMILMVLLGGILLRIALKHTHIRK